jgi:hypothetical protein
MKTRARQCSEAAISPLRPAFALRRTVTAVGARLRDDVRTPYPHKAFPLLIETVRLPLRKPEGRERSLCRLRSQVSNNGRYREWRSRYLVLRLLREGKSVGELAKTFRVHATTIYRLAATEASLRA